MGKLHYKESPTPAQKSSFSPFLAEDEELILVTGLGKAYMRSKFIIYILWPSIIMGVLGYGLGVLLGIGPLGSFGLAVVLDIVFAVILAVHHYHAHRYLLTTRRIIVKQGVFSVKVTAAMYDKITHLEVDQSFFDKIFLHHGTIFINTAGMSKNVIALEFVDYPLELKNLLERLITREREQNGVRNGGSVDTIEGEIL